MFRLYTRDQYLERISWMKASPRPISITTDIIVGFPGESAQDFEETITLLDEVRYDGVFGFKYSPRPNTPSLQYPDSVPEEEKTARLAVVLERQRQIQTELNQRHLGQIVEVMVEGRNDTRGQWIGRTSHNKVLNFTAPGERNPAVGSYQKVRVTVTHPNSLAGEWVDEAAPARVGLRVLQ
jgi:tRNA-2-methylthio-N6-dimethylallyladenosine synthase